MATQESDCITTHSPTTDDRLMSAAESGDIAALYDTMRKKPELFKELEDTHCFKDTPLHRAAANGHTDMVKELIVLQPTMGRKLNQDGLSPMHIALKEGHSEIVRSLVELDKDLVRVRGKNGHTPLHYLFIEGGKIKNPSQVLTIFLDKCPQCIQDVTHQDETPLHLAAKNSDREVFKTLMDSLWGFDNYNMKKIKGILDSKDRNGDTVLHIAASNNQPEILKLALRYLIINLEATNSKESTALQIAEFQAPKKGKECAEILRSASSRHSIYSPLVLLVQLTSQWAEKVGSMSGESRNNLLLIATLILTTTYQSALNPPGGVYQANAQTADNATMNATSGGYHFFDKPPSTAGSSVLGTGDFLLFFIPNIAAFCLFFLVACFTLISTLPTFFSVSLIASLSTLLFCLLVSAVRIISPNSQCLCIMFKFVYVPFYALCLLAIIAVALLIKDIPKKLFLRLYPKPQTIDDMSKFAKQTVDDVSKFAKRQLRSIQNFKQKCAGM